MLERKAVARTLRWIATLMELHGDNPHRIRALANASRTIERLDAELDELVASGGILEIPGIGKGTAAILEELARGEKPRVLAEVEARTPPGLKELFELPGLGPKKIRALWQDLGLTTVGELEYACIENRLVELPGFGPRTQDRLLEAIAFRRRSQERRLVHEAWGIVEPILVDLRKAGGRAEVSGRLRRGWETVDGVSVVVRTDTVGHIAALLASRLVDIESHDRTVRGVTADGLKVEVVVAPEPTFGAALLMSTGSEDHVEALVRRAAEGGLDLDVDGLRSGGELVAGSSEESIYSALQLPWIPPELREGSGEIDLASASALPDLVTLEEINGALHNHTRDSDGAASLEEMADAASSLGWRFLGIGDHSPAAHYANGLGADRLQAQWEAIDAWNASHPDLRLIKGLEADILPDGQVDIPEGCEHGLEYVVASVHSSFRLAKDAQTRRLLAAVRHPSTTVLGHPTGRLLLARPGYDVDLEAVLAACAEEGVAAEINSNPHRLDLDWHWARRALELGVRLSINPDAHTTSGLEDVRWGVTIARKAGATSYDVIGAGAPVPGLDPRCTSQG